MLLEEVVPTSQECLQSDLKKMLQRIRNTWQVTWWRFQNVSGRSCKVLCEDVAPYQQRLASYLKKLLQRDVRTYQIHLACYLKKLYQRLRNVFKVTSRKCYNVSGTSCKWRHEYFRTYQEHLARYLAKLWHRIRNVLHVTSEPINVKCLLQSFPPQ